MKCLFYSRTICHKELIRIFCLHFFEELLQSLAFRTKCTSCIHGNDFRPYFHQLLDLFHRWCDIDLTVFVVTLYDSDYWKFYQRLDLCNIFLCICTDSKCPAFLRRYRHSSHDERRM